MPMTHTLTPEEVEARLRQVARGPEEGLMDQQSMLNAGMAALAVLVQRAGGTLTLTHEELKGSLYIHVESDDAGTVTFEVIGSPSSTN